MQKNIWHRKSDEDLSRGIRMKPPEQIKAMIRHISKKKNLRPQEVLQMFLFERILERLV